MLSFRLCASACAPWAAQCFGEASLGHRRRNQRAAAVAEAMARQPGASIPDLFERPYDVKAAYTLFDRAEATPERLQAPHRAALAEALAAEGTTTLLIEETSELSWSGNQPVAGLGPIAHGDAGLQGFQLHSALAVRWPGATPERGPRPPLEVLGLAEQLYHVRQRRPAGEPAGDSKARQGRWRESALWSELGRRLGPAPAGARWERVCDRGADIYEFLTDCRALGHGFIVRAAQDRALETLPGHRASQTLFAVARAATVLGHFDLSLRGRDGRPARTARLALAAAIVRLRAPQRPGWPAGSLAGLAVSVVRVFEPDPPAGAGAPLEWMLLTDTAIESFEAAREMAIKYSARWLIEEFHKALKTGLGAERLQLETAARLFAAIAIMSLVALRLIDLREAVRRDPEAPAESAGLSPFEVRVLRARLKRPVATVHELALALGRLGGHMNRKADGMPGWQTLWRGMKKLELLVQGVRLAQELEQSG